MMFAGRSRALVLSPCLLAALALAGCGPSNNPYGNNNVGYVSAMDIPPCDKTIEISGDSNALMVTDPKALSKLQLEDVLKQVLESAGDYQSTPMEVMQRMFDSNNQEGAGAFADSVHCDSSDNPAHMNGNAITCPRAEGGLAASTGFFTPGHPDHFYPVAAVNRLDLMPMTAETCGEYRLIFAKESGLTDPNDRVFLIFEMSVTNPRAFTDNGPDIFGCRSVAQAWSALDGEADMAVVADKLHSFFFEGTDHNPNTFVTPPVDVNSLGNGNITGASYYGARGQIRVSQHMDDQWELRQFVTSSNYDYTTGGQFMTFMPVLLGNNPLPSRFADGNASYFADNFVYGGNVEALASKSLFKMSMTVAVEDLAGESDIGGEGSNDYAAQGANNDYLKDAIAQRIASSSLGADCPADDPLTADSILRRATMDSCAGCHAPSQFLGQDRKLGCGLTWPDSIGEVHITEKGERSPALKDEFLPHRAQVMTAYMQACSMDDINAAFSGEPIGSSAKALNGNRTLGGSSTH